MIIGKPFRTVEEIQRRVRELAEKISSDYAGREILAVGILKGSFMFFADIVRLIQVPMNIDFLVASSYIRTKTTGDVKIHADVREAIEGKHVVLIEDIVDTGLTMKYLKELLMKRNPASLKVCAFLDKRANRKVNLQVDYVGYVIPDHFVVGYGLDYENRYRNLPYIAIFKKDSAEGIQA
ncbi:MAG: hypoxanthine phosphoribosyltransferase [Nitrospiraceae bacterium]|nr:MAG: hypoxanthine phosphoribosyltransferase [Nitrospiraceae bacterium]